MMLHHLFKFEFHIVEKKHQTISKTQEAQKRSLLRQDGFARA